MAEVASNKVITFGGSIVVDGKPRLDTWGRQRVERVAQHYNEHRDRFRAPGARILCTGGWPLLGRGTQKPPEIYREGRMAARYLHALGVPAPLIHEEIESYSTGRNLTHAQRAGYLNPGDFTSEDPLGLASSPHHLRRCVSIAGRLGIDSVNIEQLPTAEADSRLREMAIGGIYKVALLGAHGPDAIEQREDTYILPVLAAVQGLTGTGGMLVPGN